MEPTPKPICQLIAGKTVCSYHGSLLLTQLLLNITTPRQSAAVTPAIRGEHGKENHVDLVDDLSSYIGRNPNSGGGRSAGGKPISFTTNTEGDTGAPGPPGVCPDCRQLDFKGDPGEPGTDGQRGPPGTCQPEQCLAASAGLKGVSAIRKLVREELQVTANGPKGDKGEPGYCGSCGVRTVPSGRTAAGASGQALASTSVRVIATYQAFEDIAYAFEEGTLVFTKDEKILYLKTDYQLNQWIEVANYITTTASPRLRSMAPQLFLPYVVSGKKLRLVALPTKLRGDLYYKNAFSTLGADYACQDAAMLAGLTKSYFKVFLNGQFNNLDTIVHSSQRADVPVVNLYGQQLFSSYADMLRRGAWNSKVQLQDFNGRNLSQWREHHGLSEILAWQGLRQAQREANIFSQDCEGFTNRDPMKLGYATDLLSGQLFQSREITCDASQVVLCIEAFDENAVITDPADYRRRRRRRR
uniref:Endostatin domain-containing protein n=1 Tax=Macrostomum lignano TaxID=282301 RepID=A0A1I8IIR4_9PLAT